VISYVLLHEKSRQKKASYPILQMRSRGPQKSVIWPGKAQRKV